jgi:diketogulonate reductase-like aldo/keto reductase
LPLLKLDGPQVALRWLIKGAVPIPGAKNGRQAAVDGGALGSSSEQAEIQALSTATTAWC